MKERIEERYGRLPEPPKHLSLELISEDRTFAAGKAVLRKLRFICTGDSDFSFFAYSVIPRSSTKIPFFIYLADSADIPGRFLPMEEIVDRGVGVFVLNYADITSDDGNYKSGIAKAISGARRGKSAPSKTLMWSFGIGRILEYIISLDIVDRDRLAVIGHDNLAPSVLVSGAFYKDIKYTFLNSPTEDKSCEHRFVRGHFPSDFSKFAISVSPAFSDRSLMIGLCEDDCDTFGNVHTRRRSGGKYLSREDWNYYIDFILK